MIRIGCEICGRIKEDKFCRFCDACRREVQTTFETLKIAAHELAVETVKQRKGIKSNEPIKP